MASKVSGDVLRQTIVDVMKESGDRKRKFTETIELQVGLKNYDTQKDKRFSGTLKLPYQTKTTFAVCILGDSRHCEQAEKLGIDSMDVNALKKLNKNKKLIKKLAKKYDAFMATDTVIKQIPRILGPGLNKAGKFPTILGQNDDMRSKVEDLARSIKFQLKKVLCMGVAVGNVSISESENIANTNMAINFLVSLLKKNWQNVKSLHVKSTMGKPKRLF